MVVSVLPAPDSPLITMDWFWLSAPTTVEDSRWKEFSAIPNGCGCTSMIFFPGKSFFAGCGTRRSGLMATSTFCT